MIPDHLDFRHLKRAVSIADVLAEKGLMGQFRRRSNKLTGPCPVHGGDNPGAFVVNLSRNVWHCFTRCNTGGNVVDLVLRMDRTPHFQVAKYLSSLMGGSTAEHNWISPAPEHTFRPYTKRLRLNPHSSLLKKKGINPNTAMRFDAGAWQAHGFLKDCIGVRLHDPNGSPLGYAGRRTNPMEMKKYGKWKFPTGLPKSKLLYNYHRVRSCMGQGLAVTECPWGVMRLSQLAIPAVALLGTNLSPPQFDLLRNVPRIILMLDGDRAGKNAIQQIKGNLNSVTQILSFKLPEGFDPDDLNDYELKKVSSLFLS